MDVHSPHIGPGPDVRRNTVFVPWDTPPSPKPGLVPHRKIWPAGEPFSHGGFFFCGGKSSVRRKNFVEEKKQHKKRKANPREGGAALLPPLGYLQLMDERIIHFLSPDPSLQKQGTVSEKGGGQKAHVPLRKMGTTLPPSHTASMERSAEPIMKSSWIMESLTPSARHSSSVLFWKSRMVSA